MTDTTEPAITAATGDEPEKMTVGELSDRVSDVARQLDEAASKTALVWHLAERVVYAAWYTRGKRAAIDEAVAKLLVDVKGWGKAARQMNANKRVGSLLRKLMENDEARAAGRRAPHKIKPRKTRRKKTVRPKTTA